MQTQKDHVHAYSFLMGRMTMALLLGEVSGPEVPARRTNRGLVIGLILTVLLLIGCFLYGLIVRERHAAEKPRALSVPALSVPAPGAATLAAGWTLPPVDGSAVGWR